ncbi:MAG: VCBS repeat-containing protein, partial [Cryomorphaceae bacterium]
MMKPIKLTLAIIFISTTLMGQLGNPKKIPLGLNSPGTRNSVVGDIDGDGIDDVLLVHFDLEDGDVVYRKGTSNFPYFEGVERLITEEFANALLGDFDGDGDLDVFLFRQERSNGTDGLLKFLWNDGTGNFDTQEVFENPGSSGGRIAKTGDVDDDGDMDIVYTVLDAPNAEFPSGTVWLENDGAGVFETHILGTTGAYAIALGDITNDGKTDIVITEVLADRITIYENMDNLDFEFRRDRNVKEFPSEIHLGDFNGDDLVDIVISAADVTRFISYYENKGQTNLAWNQSTINNSTMRPATNSEVADFDGDGDLDVIWSSLNAENIGWYSNDGNGIFTDEGILLSGEKTYLADLVDANSDGLPDIFSLSRSKGATALCINDGEAGVGFIRLNESRKLMNPIYSKAVQADGDVGAEVLVLNSSGNFVQIFDDLEEDIVSISQVFSEDFSQPTQGDLFDADGDADEDVLVLYQEGLVLFNREEGNYITQNLENSEIAEYFELVDLNGDEIKDVVASSEQDQSIYAWFSDNGQYGSRTLISDDLSESTQFAVVDSDSGSLLEGLVYTDVNGNVVNLPHLGMGSFGTPTTVSTTDLDFAIFEIADVDGDGLNDIVVASDIGIFRLMNTGFAELEPAILVDFEIDISELSLDDITNDGLVDLVAFKRGENDVIRIYENLGDGLFFLEKQFANNDAQSLALGDFDGDGDADIVATESTKNRAFLIKSNYPSANQFSTTGGDGSDLDYDVSVYPNPAVDA